MNSIEWLKEKYINQNCSLTIIDFDKARQMHKQEILAAFTEGANDGYDGCYDTNKEQYYEETFKQPKKD
jgi:hypothetical protein